MSDWQVEKISPIWINAYESHCSTNITYGVTGTLISQAGWHRLMSDCSWQVWYFLTWFHRISQLHITLCHAGRVKQMVIWRKLSYFYEAVSFFDPMWIESEALTSIQILQFLQLEKKNSNRNFSTVNPSYSYKDFLFYFDKIHRIKQYSFRDYLSNKATPIMWGFHDQTASENKTRVTWNIGSLISMTV